MTSTPVFRLARFLFARAIVVTNCALILAIIAFFVAQPVTGKSYSMFPNMGEGDVLVINKRAYGYSHLSCPVFLIWDTRSLCEKFDADPKSRNFSAQPERGDVISIQFDDMDFMKRVIGLPGDTVRGSGGRIFLNGKPLARRQVPGEWDAHLMDWQKEVLSRNCDLPGCPTRAFEETLPGGRSYLTLDSDYDLDEEFGPVRVPDGRYFVIGDNRGNSQDSRRTRARHGLGLIRDDQIIGRIDAAIPAFSLFGLKAPYGD